MPELIRNLVRLAFGLLAFAAVVAGLGAWLRDPITAVATTLVNTFGAPGLAVGFALTDLVPILPHSAMLLLGHVGGVGNVAIFVATSIGAMLGVSAAWSVGRFFGRGAWIQERLARFGIAAFLQKHGMAAVAVASLTPVPDSLTIVGAGASGVPLWHALLGATVRIPKIAVYLWAIGAGWSLGA